MNIDFFETNIEDFELKLIIIYLFSRFLIKSRNYFIKKYNLTQSSVILIVYFVNSRLKSTKKFWKKFYSC